MGEVGRLSTGRVKGWGEGYYVSETHRLCEIGEIGSIGELGEFRIEYYAF